MGEPNAGPVIIPRGEPFHLSGSNGIGCVLVHGFTDSPLEMRPFGEYLNHLGFSALGVRVTGHATTIDDMRRSRWPDLLASVEDGFHLLKSDATINKVFIIGHSMGGALTLLAGSYLPVDGLVALAAAYRLSAPGRLAEYWAAFKISWGSLKRKWDSRNLEERLPGWYWYQPELSRGYIKYNEKPLICNLQLVRAANRAALALPRIVCPVLLMGSRRDTIVRPNTLQAVYDRLTVTEKELIWLEKSSHMLPIDGERELVFDHTARFLHKFGQGRAD